MKTHLKRSRTVLACMLVCVVNKCLNAYFDPLVCICSVPIAIFLLHAQYVCMYAYRTGSDWIPFHYSHGKVQLNKIRGKHAVFKHET